VIRRVTLIAEALLVLIISLSVAVANAGPKMGSVPYSKIHDVAVNKAKCNLSATKLQAAMMAVTYNETAQSSSSNPPGPGVLGRADFKQSGLWPSGKSWSRVFWHAGVGMWQLDDIGLGTNAGRARFTVSGGAPIIAKQMMNNYCSHGTIASMFADWTPQSCGSGAANCLRYYNAILSNGITKVDGISNGGGSAVSHVCQYGNVSTAPHFACTFVRPWRANPCYTFCENMSGTVGADSPLSYPFYVFRHDSSTTTYEMRYWMTQDTGFADNYRASRPYGQDSRTHLTWTSAPKHLCDLTWKKGDCPSSAYACKGTNLTATPMCY